MPRTGTDTHLIAATLAAALLNGEVFALQSPERDRQAAEAARVAVDIYFAVLGRLEDDARNLSSGER